MKTAIDGAGTLSGAAHAELEVDAFELLTRARARAELRRRPARREPPLTSKAALRRRVVGRLA